MALFGGADVNGPLVENRRPVGHRIAGELPRIKLMPDIILDFEFQVVDVGQFRIGADFHGPGDGGGLVLSVEAEAVLAAGVGIAAPKNLATQIDARYSFGRR